MNKYNPNSPLKFYEKNNLKYCSYPIADSIFKYEAWGETFDEARVNLLKRLIRFNKFDQSY